jgi:hypothetical protein
MYTYYKVYLTPRNGRITYGDEIEITDYVKLDGLPTITREVDATDYEMGVYKYDDLTLNVVNIDGYFNDEFDSRSIFAFGRDRAKIRVEFCNTDGDTIVFRGLLNEEGTRLDPEADDISFRCLSRDSVIRNTKVSGGTIANGASCKTALVAILSATDITSVLNVSSANINPSLNFTIDLGSKFDNKSTRTVLNSLLLASNSIMLIDSDDNVIVRDRSEDTTRDILNLYGPFDIQQRTNIIRLTTVNSGMHRMFTAFRVNDTEESSLGYLTDYGYRQKAIDLNFVTDPDTESDIASELLEEFKVAKMECTVQVPTYVARASQLFDRVSLNYPLRVKPVEGKFLPVIGSTKIGDTEMPLPYTFGSLSIDPNVAFKIIGISENPKEFTTLLKLRQSGSDFAGGYYAQPTSCIIGYARVGEGLICAGGTECDQFTRSVIGAAQIGCTEIA